MKRVKKKINKYRKSASAYLKFLLMPCINTLGCASKCFEMNKRISLKTNHKCLIKVYCQHYC